MLANKTKNFLIPKGAPRRLVKSPITISHRLGKIMIKASASQIHYESMTVPWMKGGVEIRLTDTLKFLITAM